MTDGALRHLAAELAALEREGLLRERPLPIDDPAASGLLHLCSNDYLGYRSTRRLDRYVSAATQHAAGAGASRLVSGEHGAHRALERAICAWLETEESIVFTSGYAANVGAITALAEEGDLVVSDALNHASIIDGCRLSRAQCAIVRHNALDEVQRALRAQPSRRRWVVTESYFSMEGDGPDLAALRSICDAEDAALVLDEAHALGVDGPGGRGRAAAAGVRPDVTIGTLGKSLAAQGAFVSGSRELVRWLWNRARSFVFSTGLSPMIAAMAEGAVKEASRDDVGRARLAEVTQRFRSRLGDAGVEVANREGPIMPIVLGDPHSAMSCSQELLRAGILVQPIRPPTVSRGTSRLRVTTRADLSDREVDRAAVAIAAAIRAARP